MKFYSVCLLIVCLFIISGCSPIYYEKPLLKKDIPLIINNGYIVLIGKVINRDLNNRGTRSESVSYNIEVQKKIWGDVEDRNIDIGAYTQRGRHLLENREMYFLSIKEKAAPGGRNYGLHTYEMIESLNVTKVKTVIQWIELFNEKNIQKGSDFSK